MAKHRLSLTLAVLAIVLEMPELAHAQRGGRGGGGMARPGGMGGGMSRPGGMGGGMAHPGGGMPGGMARPAPNFNQAQNRPAPNFNQAQNRPAPNFNQAQNRPNIPQNRPATLPGNIGGAGNNFNRPGTLPGLAGNRPGPGGGFPGEINRPSTRPGNIGGGNVNVNRPGNIGGGNTVVNRPGNTNVGISNRQVNVNNTVNNVTRNNITNIQGGNRYNSNVGNRYGGDHGGWGGGGAWFGGGGYGRPSYGYGGGYGGYGGGYYRPGYGGYYQGWGGGWARPYYGNWYRGSWNSSSAFWTGFGIGALTSFGVNSLLYSYPAYGTSYAVSSYFPTWSVPTYTAWGLDPMANSWAYSGYANPYYVAAAQPVQAQAVYDYAQPIAASAAPPAPAAAETAEQIFDDARNSFMAGDYNRALALADKVLQQTPNVPVVHEFRALTLFALGRYDEAAAVVYAVLSAGPGWNWSTLVGLYPNVETYTSQLRALEAYVRSHPGSASAHFLLAYHYMVQGHADAAASEFQKVVQLQPNDTLSASFAKALALKSQAAATPTTTPTAVAAATAPANANPSPAPAAADESQAQAPPPPPPPDNLIGKWKATPAPGLSIALSLEKDGAFTWDVDEKGEKQSLQGRAGFQDGVLALDQGNGPPLVGKVTQEGADKFTFRPAGVADNAPALTFTR
jgi:tetratricopeptide (TPR) repeat protein